MIYPKQFRSAKIPTEKKYCFFLMPFNKMFDDIYGELKSQLTDMGYKCNRADELTHSKPIITKILTEILKAQYIIVDLTGDNANVFYELGITHTFKDSQNVLLLKQKNDAVKVPFDVTHLQYNEYRPDNLRQLVSIVRKFIESNAAVNEFYEALNINGVIPFIHDNNDEFVGEVQNYFNSDLELLTNILNGQIIDIDKADIEVLFNKFQRLIYDTICQNKSDYLHYLLNIYSKICVYCAEFDFVSEYVNEFLTGIFSHSPIPEKESISYKTDMVITLAEKDKLLDIVVPWILNYFTRSKSASIDLNRYKLEAFLMRTDSSKINEAICNALFNRDCHIREHMADIIGEKRLIDGRINLCRKLVTEDNYYTAVSIMEAIGKLGHTEDIQTIFIWLESYGSDVAERKMYSVFRHAEIAILRLDKSSDKRYHSDFREKYGKYLVDFVPL